MSFDFAYFGKLPAFGDFLRHNASKPEMQNFDKWLQEGLYYAKNALKPNFENQFASLAMSFFYPDKETGNILVGGLKASNDQIGRHYPFYVTLLIKNPNHQDFQKFSLSPIIERFLHQVFRFITKVTHYEDAALIEREFDQFIQSLMSDSNSKDRTQLMTPMNANNPEQSAVSLNGINGGYQIEIVSREPEAIYSKMENFSWESDIPYLFWHAESEVKFLYVFGKSPSPKIFINLLDVYSTNGLVKNLSE